MTAAEAINHLRGRAAIAAEIEARAIVVEVEAINLTLATVDALRRQVEGLCERVSAASEVLTRLAEKREVRDR